VGLPTGHEFLPCGLVHHVIRYFLLLQHEVNNCPQLVVQTRAIRVLRVEVKVLDVTNIGLYALYQLSYLFIIAL